MLDSEIQKLSFEQALQKLEGIIADMEKGGLDLEKSIASYEVGIRLKKYCEKKLKEAELKIEKITIDEAGTVSSSNFKNL